MKFITTANAAAYHAWWARAQLDDSVWPYISVGRHSGIAPVEDSDWSRTLIMDDTDSGLLFWAPDRDAGERCAILNMWVLAVPARPLIAASLFAMVPKLIRRHGVACVGSVAHASNRYSIPLLRRHLGEPWGIQPGGAWNGLLGVFEDKLCFQARAATILYAADMRSAS